MGTEAEHTAQAQHNQRFLDSIDHSAFPDWVATVAFYKALHRVQVLFARRGHTVGTHTQRNNILKSRYPEVWKHYHALYNYSRLTRYRCYQATPAEIAQILTTLADTEAAIDGYL